MDAVAIHNKNGKGLLPSNLKHLLTNGQKSQSTIKMEKGYYSKRMYFQFNPEEIVAIHNKNGKGLLLETENKEYVKKYRRNPQ